LRKAYRGGETLKLPFERRSTLIDLGVKGVKSFHYMS